MTRIAYVINSVEGGGAALPVPAIARVLCAHGAGVRVLALTARDARALAPMRAAGLEVEVREGGERDHGAALRWLGARVGSCSPDLIWTSLTRATLLGQLVGARLGVPVVSWQHAAYLKPANLALLRATRRLTRLWIADSHCVAEHSRLRLGVPAERLAVWPLFAADARLARAQPWAPGALLRIGTLGRLHPVKGYDVLIDALARLRDQDFAPIAPFELVIAGEGADRARLERKIADANLGNCVRLIGYVEDPRAFLAGLHLYVQPSRSEGLCVAVHEAMQAGLPVITSRVGEMPHTMVDELTGFVVTAGDAQALAAALARMLADPARLAPMGEAARRRVLERFGAEAFEAAGREIMARLMPVPSTRLAACR